MPTNPLSGITESEKTPKFITSIRNNRDVLPKTFIPEVPDGRQPKPVEFQIFRMDVSFEAVIEQ